MTEEKQLHQHEWSPNKVASDDEWCFVEWICYQPDQQEPCKDVSYTAMKWVEISA